MRQGRARHAGFTLVELLVAISILAIVAVLGWRGLDGIVRARTTLTEQMETTRGMQLAFAQLQSDCERIANPEILDRRPYLLTGTDRITMVRTVFNENEPSRLQVVAYRVINGTLMRRESVATRDLAQLDSLWNAAISDLDTTPPVALQPGVSGMQTLVFQNNTWHDMSQSSTNGVQLPPTGLQVALQVNGLEAPMTKAFLLQP
ncbi:prepilin-type N-terminal cleavage/methylation domain-containing protein [Massilia horti]|uniref:Prepilin-type N-terminal cleavage/methylation domain-containing protein n=2 Tax=Massilia horti TaxID=2562153 RepID=A0A4Y9T7B7_9BURK|nr:prepilin-type N-terminal cleavage/methylation domain-containing protein [Massilia horti]